MRFNNNILFALAVGMMASPVTAPSIGGFGGLDVAPVRQKKGKGRNNRRGKGKVSSPKRKPNLLTISKRVRRKHRRAGR